MDCITPLPSPFLEQPDRPRVEAAFGDDPYALARSVLSRWPLSLARGARVLLKPNAGRVARVGTGTNTSPQVVAAAIDAFVDAGAQVSVGDSPIAGVGPLKALEASGIAEVVRQRGVRLIDLDERPARNIAVPEGEAVHSLKVCADVLEHDLLVSIPVIKTHMHTVVTLSIKNMKGCLWRRSKVVLHMLPPVVGSDERPLDHAIADLASVLRPHFSLIDGTLGMQGLGPSAGTPKHLGAVVASPDGFAADALACALMGRRAENVPHLRLGAERGLGIIDVPRLHVNPENWAAHVSPFDAPPSELSLEMPRVRVMDSKACSACQSTLMLLLTRHGPSLFDYFPGNDPVTIAIGKGHSSVEPGTLCLGNCTMMHRKTGLFVPGCPPVVSAVHSVLGHGPDKDDDQRR